MPNLLLTGASGFLGSSIRNKYESSDWNVITLGRSNSCDVHWSLGSRAIDIRQLPKEVDRIIHCAAVNETMIAGSLIDSFDVNVTLTRSLADIAKKFGTKEFLYLSTFHVYGRYSGQISVDDRCDPISDYGLTHYLSEEILRNALRDSDVSVLCLRPTNVFGIPESISSFDRWSLVPFSFIRQSIENGYIHLKTSGTQKRNFVDISNVVEAEPGKQKFEIRNIYGDDTLSIRDFAGFVAHTIEKNFDKRVGLTVDGNFSEINAKAPDLSFGGNSQDYMPKGNLEDFILDFTSAYLSYINA